MKRRPDSMPGRASARVASNVPEKSTVLRLLQKYFFGLFFTVLFRL